MTRHAKMDDESNLLLLRIDVHKLWDQRHFTIVPRLGEVDQKKTTQWVIYVFKRQPFQEVVQLYHDVCLQTLSEIHVQFLFCRFAWTIFESLDMFLDQGSERWLMVRNPFTGIDESTRYNAMQCRDKAFTRRGRSQSPKKRKTPASDAGEAAEEEEERNWESSRSPSLSGRSNVYCSSLCDQDSSDGEVGRGRKRRQLSIDLAMQRS